MAIASAIQPKFPQWQVEYKTALREYSRGVVSKSFERAVTGCINALRELAFDTCNFPERRAIYAALNDLLVLRASNYRYGRMGMLHDARS